MKKLINTNSVNLVRINGFILLIFICFSNVHSQCPDADNNFMEKYWATRENLDKWFVANTIDELTGELTSDGIGTWDCEKNMYTLAGVGIPANRIANGTQVKYGDATYGLGRYFAMLATEYALLSQSGQVEAKKRTINELFLALQAYRRLDMTANRLYRKYVNCKYGCNVNLYSGVDLSGYSGFFVRDDANWHTTSPLMEKWINTSSSGSLVGPNSDFINNETEWGSKEIVPPSTNPSFIACDECPSLLEIDLSKCGNIISQDQVIGLLFGLSHIKKFIPSGTYVSINGEQFEDDILTIAQKITYGLVTRIERADGYLRYPKEVCYATSEFGEKITKNGSQNARAIYYGLVEAANFILNGNTAGLPMVPHRNFHFEDVPPIFGLAGQALELIPIPDENFWRAGCNWMIAGPDDINIQEILGLPFPVIVPGIVNWIIEELLAFFILDDEVLIGEGTWNYHSQTMLIDLMVAGNTDFYESWGDANESANDVAHGYDNWLMMQRFAMKTMHNNSNLLQNDFDWMRNVLCEYACPWPCYVQPGTTVPANFECNNQAGGYWDCGPLWGSKPLHLNCQGNTINYTSSFGNGIDYMLAYNQFQLAGGTSNQNYFNPFDYEITPENKDDLSNGYEGMNEVISVAESLTPCDRTVQYYHLVGEQFECPEFTTSDNLQILSTTHDMVQIRILSKKEKSWIIVEETCGNFDQCHLPKKIRIILEIKDKCDDACVTNSYEIVNITTNQTWGIDNSKSFIHATVYVHPNATLTLNNFTGFFDFAGGIQVERGAKLIVAESTLTKCPESVNWIGIRVAGNSELDQPDYTTTPTINQSGIVFLQNSTIENARFGIETSGAFGNYGSPLFNGGLVHCENSTFLNNDYGAKFNMYFKPNKSKMVGCTFKRDLTGATVGIGAYIDATSGRAQKRFVPLN